MPRQACTAALTILAAFGCFTLLGCGWTNSTKPDATAHEIVAGHTAESLPKELALDIGQGIKLEMVLIQAGEFSMGSPDSDKDARDEEKPQHRVHITRPFYLGKYVVTQEQWQAVMGKNPSYFIGPKNPVDSVSWDDCQEYVARLNKRFQRTPNSLPTVGGRFRLPTEAEWEYACRAGSKAKFCFGDDDSSLGEYAWHLGNSGDKPNPVGQKKPNAFGLFDMHGNAGEWCQDWYDERYYSSSVTDDPPGPTAGSNRVNRGGGWDRPGTYCRSAFRSYYAPGFRLNYLGLRVSLVPANK
jgi:formylglycine-generating enzyme required for sulfatase activity